MPRPRNPANADLPPRVQAVRGKRGTVRYYYRAAGGRKIPLGTDANRMRVEWARIENAGTTPGTFRAAWLAFIDARSPKLSPRTRKDYAACAVPLLAVFGPHPLEAIQPHHVARYMDERGKAAPVRANREKALLSAIWNWSRGRGITSQPNPCAGVHRHPEKARGRYVRHDELAAILTHASPILVDAIRLSYLTGQRTGDVLKSRRQDVQDGALCFRQGKTGTMVRVRLEGALAAVVEEILTRPRPVTGQWLVQDEAGQPVGYWRLRALFDRARKAAGLDFQFRDLRAKAGTDKRRESGWDAAQLLLGHLDPSTTRRYIRDAGDDVAPVAGFGTGAGSNGTR